MDLLKVLNLLNCSLFLQCYIRRLDSSSSTTTNTRFDFNGF